jgi:curved DNA-binding protein CbpA
MNPYEILEIAPGASSEDIKAAYHRLAKQWHPDRFSGPEKAAAEQRFRMLAEAFNMLKDTVRPEVPPQAPSQAPPQISLDEPAPAAEKERTAEDWYTEAKAAFDRKEYDRALGLSQYSLRMDSEKADYHLLVGKSLEAMNGDKKAIVKAYENVIRLNPKDVDALIRLAEIFQSLGMHVRATRLWERARHMAPDHKVFHREQKNKAAQIQGFSEQLHDLLDQGKALFQRLFHRG